MITSSSPSPTKAVLQAVHWLLLMNRPSAFQTALPAASEALCSSACFLGNTVALCSLPAVRTLDLATGAVAGKVVFHGMAGLVEPKGLL